MKKDLKVRIKQLVKNKKILILALLFVISIGYAIIQTSFGFDGLALLTGRINIYFDNLVVSEGSVIANTPASIVGGEKLKINFDIQLSDPKEFYEFEVDIVNDSNHDGRISKVIKSNIPTELEDYIIYTIKYIDNGKDVLYGDTILKNNKRRIKVRIEFKEDINLFSILSNNTSSDPLSLNMSYELSFIDNEKFVSCSEINILGNKVSACIDNGQSEFVASTDGIDYNAIPSDTNGKGLYLKSSTENDENPIYFYRGEIDSNHVIFGDFCWKIVRTTEKGGTKLIYDGVPNDNGECVNTGVDTQIGTGSFNMDMWSRTAGVGYMYGEGFWYSQWDDTPYIYASDVIYNNGEYTLVDPIEKADNMANVKTKHYTCKSSTLGTCSEVFYVYSFYGNKAYALPLKDGRKYTNILEDSFANTNDSDIKKKLDLWFESNLLEHQDYLEDSIWCNDRSIYDGGFKKDGNVEGEGFGETFFGAVERLGEEIVKPDITVRGSCPNKSDRFTVSDTDTGNGKLKYSVGLLTTDEYALVNSVLTSNSYLTSGESYWLMTPYAVGGIGYNAAEFNAEPEGYIQATATFEPLGVRPSIVLKAGTTSISGDGTATNPYVITSNGPCKKVTLLGNKVEACPDNESSPYVTSETGINYKQLSSDTNGKGLYLYSSTKNDGNPIYFYRGEVDNNNVLFANKCWQIVRTTETGGTKLIYNGLPDSNGKCERDSSKNGSDRQLTDTIAYGTGMDSPANAGYMVGIPYNYKSKDMTSTTYQYGNSVTYSGGVYTLTDAKEITWGGDISNNHYTCFTTGTTCSTVYYIYYAKDTVTAHYIELQNGKKVEDALDEMLLQNNTDSNVKNYLENTWFASTMLDYDDYLEDTVWCADLSISRYGGYAGWDPNGGDITEDGLLFTPNNDSTFECKNPSDRFTVSTENGNGKSKYKVGMITRHEAQIAGLRGGFTDHPSYLATGSSYWMISPSNFRNSWARALAVSEDGGIYGSAVLATDGVRPMISLKKGTIATGGDGTATNPYVVS